VALSLERALSEPSADAEILVAEDAHREPLGFVSLQTATDFTGEIHSHITDLVVCSTAEGRGVGAALLREAESWAVRRRHRLLALNVFTGNHRARELYERMGFLSDTIRMVKELRSLGTLQGWAMNQTKRSEFRRVPVRGSHDWDTIKQILDVGFLAHVGFCVEGQPFVIPTLYGREGEKLYLHGSAASRMLRQLETGIPACVTVTLVDGLVLSRSAFDHSMNYRSVVAFGMAKKIVDPAEKIVSLRVISEHLIPGRWAEVRGPSESELKATSVLEFLIDEASAKVRSGPPQDNGKDYGSPVWAGVLPLEVRSRTPIPDDNLVEGVAVPDYVLHYDPRLEGARDVEIAPPGPSSIQRRLSGHASPPGR
jgi:uncharacterized protein